MCSQDTNIYNDDYRSQESKDFLAKLSVEERTWVRQILKNPTLESFTKIDFLPLESVQSEIVIVKRSL